MEISSYLRTHARTLPGKSQLIITSFAKALEVIPRTICDNAGLDATDVLNKLRMLHAKGETWAGVSVEEDEGKDGVRDNMEAFVWEPALVKVNALEGATEAACVVLSVDETVTHPSSAQVRLFLLLPTSSLLSVLTLSRSTQNQQGGGRGGGMAGRGRGRGR
jgi:T-complex protein 1 subunit eta